MESGAQLSGGSSSEDESPPSVRRRPSLGTVPKHSTPEDGFLHGHRSPLGRVPYRRGWGPAEGSPMPARSSRDLPSPVRKRRLSTIWASEESSAQLESDAEPWAPGEEPPAPAEVTQQRRRQQQKAQQGESPGSWTGSQGLPGIPNTAGRRSRDLKKLAAVTEHVRQWEARQLRSIEEATHHDLTVQDE